MGLPHQLPNKQGLPLALRGRLVSAGSLVLPLLNFSKYGGGFSVTDLHPLLLGGLLIDFQGPYQIYKERISD